MYEGEGGMIKRFNSIRFRYIRSHLYALFITMVILLSVLLMIHVLLRPDWLNGTSIVMFILLYLIVGIVISFYVGFQSSDSIKVTLDSISVLITQFANGNYDSSISITKDSEFSRIANELNTLGGKLQSQVKSLQRMADEKSELAKSAHMSAVIEERQRLARDLHDAVSQQLFALTMMSEAAVKQLEKNPATAKAQMEDVVKAALQSQTEMRALLLHLRPVHLSGDALPTGIHQLISELKQKSQIDFHVSVQEDLALPDTIEEHVFRIIQESLSNILRHAFATDVTINLSKRATELFIHIRDNGKGFDINQRGERKTSYGLKTMRERSEELGGTFTIRSGINEGTYIDIRIPC